MRHDLALKVATLVIALGISFEAGALYGRYLQSRLPNCAIVPGPDGIVQHYCVPPSTADPFQELQRN